MALPEKRKRTYESGPKQSGEQQPKSILKKQRKSASTTREKVQKKLTVEEDPVNASEDEDGGDELALDDVDHVEDSERDGSDVAEDGDFQDVKPKKVKKSSKDPASFAAAMSAILSSSLKAHARSNPILVRSKSKKDAEDKAAKAEHRINKAIAAQKKALRSIGHVEDLSTDNAKDIEYERTMRETARRGVIKIFNAVNASQIKAEQAQREARGLGPSKLQEQVKDMSRERFLDLIKSA